MTDDEILIWLYVVIPSVLSVTFVLLRTVVAWRRGDFKDDM